MRQFFFTPIYANSQTEARAIRRKRGAMLQLYMSQDQGKSRGDNFSYDGTAWAIIYIAHRLGSDEQVFVNFYITIAELEQQWRKRRPN